MSASTVSKMKNLMHQQTLALTNNLLSMCVLLEISTLTQLMSAVMPGRLAIRSFLTLTHQLTFVLKKLQRKKYVMLKLNTSTRRQLHVKIG